jgi:PAS domain S-box-containing protein
MLDDLKAVLERLPVGIYICEAPSGIIRLYNRRAAELWGREPRIGSPDERFCGSLRLFRPDGRPLPHGDTPMAEALRSGDVHDETVVIERPDGSRVTVRVNVAPLRDRSGRVVGAVNAFRDVTDQERAHEALRMSEARYRAVVENQPEMVCRFLPDGTITFANEAYCRYFGLDRRTLIGRPYAPVVHPEDRAAVAALVASLSPANRVVVIENRVCRGDGTIRWTQWTNHAIYDADDRLVELQSTGRDVTERKAAEDAAARLAAVVASAEDAIVSKTLDGIVTSWNRAAERMLGYSAAEMVDQPITRITPPELLAEEAAILQRLARGEATESFETERIGKDGRRIPVSLSISPVKDASGRIIGASTIARDITERRRAEGHLQATVQRLEALYRLADRVGRAKDAIDVCEAAVEAIMACGADRASALVFDDAGVMRFCAWRNLSDAYRAAVEGHSPWTRDAIDPVPITVEDVLADPGLGSVRGVIVREGIRALAFVPLVDQGRLLGKFMVYHDAPHRFSEDELRLAATIAHHVAFGLGRVEAEAAIRDLLVREQGARCEADLARAEAERASRAKDEFLAMLAHELRNPLSVIVNAIAAVNSDAGLPADLRRAGATVGRQTDHLTRLLDDLLDVSRITSGRIQLELELVDLHDAIDLAVESQRHRIDTKRQRLTTTTPDGPVMVMGDAVRLQQVVGNLLNNASKYSPAGASLAISLAREGGEAVLRVRDDGTGIPPESLGSIFDVFVQASPTLARTEGGLGIGLTPVKRVVELHRGSVRAHSEGAGRGAEFVVRLPLATGRPPGPAEPARTPAPDSRRVLVIEDHPDGREMLVLALHLQGHQVFEAATGAEGLEAAVQHHPEVVLVDIGLPDQDGYEVGRQLREKLGTGVRLIAVTGYGQPQDRARSSEVGFDLHLVKPVDPTRLAGILHARR